MSNLAIKDNVTVVGVEVPNISGGFGEGKKAMLAKHIADIHGKKLFKVNEVINNNRQRFKDNIDIIDVKGSEFEVLIKKYKLISQNSLNRSKNIYLLSESGYRILCNSFEDATIGKIVLSDYFNSHDKIVIFAEKRKEILFKKEIDKIFEGLCTLVPQYYVKGYRIDFYIPEINVAIEYDENSHKYKKELDDDRQLIIEKELGCKFVRISEFDDYAYAVNKILKVVFGDFGMSERDRLKLIFKSKTDKSWELYEEFLDDYFSHK